MQAAISTLIDPSAIAVVFAGTWLATAVRCGWKDLATAFCTAGGLLSRGFDVETNRKALALAVTAINRDGHLRANPALPPDPSLRLILDTHLRRGPNAEWSKADDAEREHGATRQAIAVQVFFCAGELSPVFGLVGTLFGFTQLNPIAGSSASVVIMSAVSTAVLSTLYGALQAHFVCFPLASAIERRARIMDAERTRLAQWFSDKVGHPESGSQVRRAYLRAVPSESDCDQKSSPTMRK